MAGEDVNILITRNTVDRSHSPHQEFALGLVMVSCAEATLARAAAARRIRPSIATK
jgi:hypothetical protein